jgi:hypothetical protein
MRIKLGVRHYHCELSGSNTRVNWLIHLYFLLNMTSYTVYKHIEAPGQAKSLRFE